MNRTRLLLVIVLLLLGSRTAFADTTDEQTARKLFAEGLELHQSHDYAGALAKFREAYRRWKNPKILANIGTEAWELGNFAVAANAYDRFLAEAPADAPNRADVERALREVQPKVGTLVGTLTGPAQSATVDGIAVEPARLHRLHVAPGRHVIVAVGTNGKRVERQIDVAAGARVIFTVRLDAQASANPGPVESDNTVERSPEKPHEHSSLPWVVGGIGAASLVASAVLYSMRNNTESDLKTECFSNVCPDASQDKIDRANRLGAASAITFGIGVAGIGAAAYLFLKPSSATPPAEQSAIDLRVTASPRGASATFGGRF
jgi:hypothetical protein